MLGERDETGGAHRGPGDDDVFYFLGNITSHVVHALPLWKEIGGEFVVLSQLARERLVQHPVPVGVFDDLPRQWRRTGRRLLRTDQYLHVPSAASRTVQFLEEHARVVLFYELFDFGRRRRLNGPRTLFLSHGNAIKPYFAGRDRIRLLGEHDFVAAPGPYGRSVMEDMGVAPEKLVDLGVARADEVVARRGPRSLSRQLAAELGEVSGARIVTYVPTYWGPSSVLGTGLALVRQVRSDQILLVRLHPQTPPAIVAAYRSLAATRPHVHLVTGDLPGRGLLDLLAAADVVVGELSSVMVEAILLHKPLVFAVDHESVGLLTGDHPVSAVVARSTLLQDGATDIASSLDEAIGAGVDAAVWAEAVERLFFHADGSCRRHIADFVESL